jgi:hypothetical protein
VTAAVRPAESKAARSRAHTLAVKPARAAARKPKPIEIVEAGREGEVREEAQITDRLPKYRIECSHSLAQYEGVEYELGPEKSSWNSARPRILPKASLCIYFTRSAFAL